jgi:DNA-binding XRE family transcriptional regulator
MRKPKDLVVELRKVIGKSQSQFAAMIGVSKYTVISVENDRNDLSRLLAKRIQIATGANLLRGELKSPFSGKDYSREDFDEWRKERRPTDQATAQKEFDEMKFWLKIIFLAAARSGRAGNRDRLPALCISFTDWLQEACEKFKLMDEIQDVLEGDEHKLQRGGHSVTAMFEKPKKAQELLAPHGIDFNKVKTQLKKYLPMGWLIVEDEYRRAWGPGYDPEGVICDTRKLIPKPRFGVVMETPGIQFHELMKLLREAEVNDSFFSVPKVKDSKS